MNSIRKFAYDVAGVSPQTLMSIADEIGRHYRVSERLDGRKLRRIAEPSPVLMRILRRINKRVLSVFPLPSCVHSCRGSSPYTNASVHVAQPWLVRLDIENFFPSIGVDRVHLVWREQLRFGEDLSRLLSRLTTYNGSVPLGAPTSSSLGNIVLVKADLKIMAACAAAGVNYSRWVDDLNFSGADAPKMIGFVRRIVLESGFRVNRRKVLIAGRWRRQVVTGLGVNAARPTILREFVSQLRAEIHRLDLIDGYERAALLKSVQGSLAYVNEANPALAKKLSARVR